MQEHSRRVFEEYQGRAPAPPVPPREAQAAGFTQPTLRPPGLYTRFSPPADNTPACQKDEAPPLAPHKPPASFDGEQWLLLGLALLLFRSGCRPELAIALLYLAL